MTRDHYVEVDLGEDAPQSGPLYLIAHGSIYPTDSSINVAMSQGERWHAARPEPRSAGRPRRLGRGPTTTWAFPPDARRPMLVRSRPTSSGRARRAGCACAPISRSTGTRSSGRRGLPDTQLKTIRLDPPVADLHYRGYSVIDRPDAASPKLPDYNQISGTKQRWRDLIGYYTRFGDVRELLETVDDRYVIMNSGDEMSLRFPSSRHRRPAGCATTSSSATAGSRTATTTRRSRKTVLPLPYHARQTNTPRRPAGSRTSGLTASIPRTGRRITRATSRRRISESRCGDQSNTHDDRSRSHRIVARASSSARCSRRRSRSRSCRPHSAKPAVANCDAGRRWPATGSISRRSRRLGHRLRASGADLRSASWITSCRRSRRWAPRCRSSISTATAGPTSTSSTAARAARTRLYRNLGDGTFKDVAGEMGIADLNQPGTGVSMGAVWGDYDNDGYEDLLVYQVGTAGAVPQRRGQAASRASPSRPGCRRGSTPTPRSGSTTTATACSTCSSAATIPRTSTSGISRRPRSCRRASSTRRTAAASICSTTSATASSRTSARRWASTAGAGRWPRRPPTCAAPAIPISSSPTTTASPNSTSTTASASARSASRPGWDLRRRAA